MAESYLAAVSSRTLAKVLNSRDNALLCISTVTRLTEHDDVIKSLLRGAPRLGLALGPAPRCCIGPRTCKGRPWWWTPRVDSL